MWIQKKKKKQGVNQSKTKEAKEKQNTKTAGKNFNQIINDIDSLFF